MRYRFRLSIVLFAFVLVLCAAGCRRVEDASDLSSITVVIPASDFSVEEPFMQTESETVGNTAETEVSTGNDTETVSEASSKKEETAANSEIKSGNAGSAPEMPEFSETIKEIAQVSQTTALTLQYESPQEVAKTTEIKTETALKTETQTVSELQTTKKKQEKSSYSALNFDEQKGFWITYLEYASILRNKSEKSFRKSVEEYFDNISDLGFNTVYVQVRAFGDAYYASELFPSGEQFDGTIGTQNSFDALRVMIECAHERGMSAPCLGKSQCGLMTTSQIEKLDDSYTIKKWYNSRRGEYIVKSGDRWYLNPAYDEVTDLIAAGITEIAENYKVDGIQIDDYFYPTTDNGFDSAAYAASGNGASLSDWRIANVNRMVKKLYKAVHNANDTMVFGISPQGSVENNYGELYADVRKWCSESGYCDYILPQVYFGFDNAALPYADVIALWNSMVKSHNVKLVIGLAAYKVGAEDGYAGSGKREWLENSDILSRQMKLAETLENYGGVALYRYDSVFRPTADVAAQVSKEIKNIEK